MIRWLALGVVALVSGFAGPASATLPGTNGRIALVRDGPVSHVVLVPRAGDSPLSVTEAAAADHEPVLSPDGRRIAFVSDRDGGAALFVARADGRDLRRLTTTAPRVSAPAWSPDGRSIAYATTTLPNPTASQPQRWREVTSLWIVDIGGGAPVRRAVDLALNPAPVWSPDGSRLAYWAKDGLWTIARDGSKRRRLVARNLGRRQQASRSLQTPSPDPNAPVVPTPVSWSPTGDSLVYASAPEEADPAIRRVRVQNGHVEAIAAGLEPAHSPQGDRLAWIAGGELVVAGADGSRARRVTRFARVARYAHASPTWSPDGRWLAVVVAVPGFEPPGLAGLEAWVLRPDGSALRRLLVDLSGSRLSWTPDGQRLAIGQTMGNRWLVTVEPDGRDLRVLARGVSTIAPAWSPDGSRIAFVRDGDTIVTTAADGSNSRVVKRLTTPAHPFGFTRAPALAWSPDGAELAFSVHPDGTPASELHAVAFNGAERAITQVERWPMGIACSSDEGPSWAPDGTRLVFTRTPTCFPDTGPQPPQGARVVNRDGSGTTEIVAGSVTADWSPDGTRIAITRDGTLWTIRPDGSDLRAVPGSPTATYDRPVWSPDGTKLVVVVQTLSGERRIEIVDPATGTRHLLLPPGPWSLPAWQPLPAGGSATPRSSR